ncbi:hypothetical protein [Nocardia sp. CA-120079]|uniref:hypothetical protein n=1 Tax=Nocardia sp. CA-120079 TaxID=3239974 RepID=UPI003D957302
MTTMLSAAPTAAEMADRYRKINGLYSTEATADDKIVLRVGAVTGIRILQSLADPVRAELARQSLRTPTITYPRTRAVMFLVNATPGENGWDNTFFRYSVARTKDGATIALPGPGDTVRTWLDAPQDHWRVDFDTLAHITNEAASTRCGG